MKEETRVINIINGSSATQKQYERIAFLNYPFSWMDGFVHG